jgi:hypothetical protein
MLAFVDAIKALLPTVFVAAVFGTYFLMVCGGSVADL